MCPCGMTASTAPVPPSSDTDPSDSNRAVNPFRFSGYTHEVPTSAECNTSDSFTPSPLARRLRSTPANTSAYTTDDPDTVGATAAAPESEYDTTEPDGNDSSANFASAAELAKSTWVESACALGANRPSR